jgi:hypothetical protein
MRSVRAQHPARFEKKEDNGRVTQETEDVVMAYLELLLQTVERARILVLQGVRCVCLRVRET